MIASAAAAAILAAVPSAAQQAGPSAGAQEYAVACAVCHGESGMGAGPMTQYLNIEVPGLTRLAAANDGVFPYLEMFQIIDGRTGVRGHGGPMPVWGDRYSASAQEDFGIHGAEVVTRGRIAVLTDYLLSIQE
jgi:mono/diheme cytochrome c family protein